MDPIVAVFEITLTIRAPEGTEVEAPTVAEIEVALAAAGVDVVTEYGTRAAGTTANAIAKRTDR